jgi:hypothetical protein
MLACVKAAELQRPKCTPIQTETIYYLSSGAALQQRPAGAAGAAVAQNKGLRKFQSSCIRNKHLLKHMTIRHHNSSPEFKKSSHLKVGSNWFHLPLV